MLFDILRVLPHSDQEDFGAIEFVLTNQTEGNK
jgi:hypothetical protein